jgi:hypothetical protein
LPIDAKADLDQVAHRLRRRMDPGEQRREQNMKNWIAISAALLLVACGQQAATHQRPAETGGSRSGDFGPRKVSR